MKKIALCILCMSFLASCANMSFEPRASATISPISAVETNLGLDLVSAGKSSFMNIQNSDGMVNVTINIATFTKNADLSVLVTEAIAYAPEGWVWQFGPTNLYGGLGNSSIGLQSKNFELSLFMQSGQSNIYSDLFNKETMPKQWLVCQAVRVENFSTEKIILDYREIAPDLALSPASPELLAFRQRAIEYFEKMLIIATPQSFEGYPNSLATRFLGSFVGELSPNYQLLLKR